MIGLKENEKLTPAQKKKFKAVQKSVNAKKPKPKIWKSKYGTSKTPKYKVAKAFKNLYGR